MTPSYLDQMRCMNALNTYGNPLLVHVNSWTIFEYKNGIFIFLILWFKETNLFYIKRGSYDRFTLISATSLKLIFHGL